jgi:hypothetical protein
MRRAFALVLVALLSAPAPGVVSAPAHGLVKGVVTVDGRPLQGAELNLVEVRSGAVTRVSSAADGSFEVPLAPGDYVLASGGTGGLAVGRGPALLSVTAGTSLAAAIELVSASPVQAPEGARANLSIDHTPVGCLVAGEHPLIDASFSPAAEAAKARVFFRSALASGYFFVEMAAEGQAYQGRLPRPKVEASPIQYYVAVYDAAGAQAKTPVYSATVVRDKAECPEGARVAAMGGSGGVQVFSAATGAAITPAGFAASGLAIGAGVIGLVLSTAAAAGISATINVFNPEPSPSPTIPPTPRPTPTPTPRPTPVPTPTPTATPTPGPPPTTITPFR